MGTRPDQVERAGSGPTRYRGLLVDFGGVLTTSVIEAFKVFCTSEGLEPDAVFQRLMESPQARRLVVELECGRIDEAAFEPAFAGILGVAPERLIDRLYSGSRPAQALVSAVLAARRAGIRTGLLSNSWGEGRYQRDRFGELFDAVVISGEVGLRKPDPAIYLLAAESLGLEPAACVFVDDFAVNLEPAEELGMATVLHEDDADRTIAALEQLLGVRLRP
ncbi:MAG TPA: HAD family phosphatase [Actinomycetota bacterium]|jgi:epoxide hydrolase-like predicted phosphatase|nr:HAD family phosphatase [Actinomycetota bacterium]